MKKHSTKYLTSSAMFAALILVLTYFHTPMPNANGGYVHLGDAVIFLAACIMPLPYACAVAAVGAGLADIISGFAIWAPATIIIKILLVLMFTSKRDKILCKRNAIALIPALIITVAGYYVAEAIIYGNWATPVASVIGNVMQWLGSCVVYVLVAISLDKVSIKKTLFKQEL